MDLRGVSKRFNAATRRILEPEEDDIGLAQRAKDAFTDLAARGYSADYLSALRDAYNGLHDDSRRNQRTLVIVAVVFELISRAAIQGAQFGPVEVTDLSLIHKALPVAFGFELSWAITLNISLIRVTVVHNAVIATAYPSLVKNGVEQFPLAGGSLADEYAVQDRGTASVSPRWWRDNPLRQTLRAINKGERYGVLATLSFVGVYMIYQLFRTYGVSDWLVWVSTLISAIYALDGFMLYLYTLYLRKRESREGA